MLLVEDPASGSRASLEALEPPAFSALVVEYAKNVEEAVQRLRQDPPDAVVVGLGAHEGAALDAIRCLSPHSRGVSLLVVDTSGAADLRSLVALTLAGGRAQRLEAAGRLAGNIAHDFNNLLTGIMTFTSLVRETIDAGDSRRDDLGHVLTAGKRAIELTRQLLALTRTESIAPGASEVNALSTEPVARNTPPPPERLPQARGGETILLVEDEPLVRQSVVRMLRRGGYKFVEATNGVEACELFALRRQEIHLALLDVVMPELSGPETAVRLRALSPSLKILFMSGYPRDFFDANAEARHLGPLVQKPMTEDALLSVLRRVLDGQEAEAL